MSFRDKLLQLGCQGESISGGLFWRWPVFHSRFEISLKSAQTMATLRITSPTIYLSIGSE